MWRDFQLIFEASDVKCFTIWSILFKLYDLYKFLFVRLHFWLLFYVIFAATLPASFSSIFYVSFFLHISLSLLWAVFLFLSLVVFVYELHIKLFAVITEIVCAHRKKRLHNTQTTLKWTKDEKKALNIYVSKQFSI